MQNNNLLTVDTQKQNKIPMKKILIVINIFWILGFQLHAQNDSIVILKSEYNTLKQNKKEYNKLITAISTCNEKQEKLNATLENKNEEFQNLQNEIEKLKKKLKGVKSIELLNKDIKKLQTDTAKLNSTIAQLLKWKEKDYDNLLKLREDSINAEKEVYNEVKKSITILNVTIRNINTQINKVDDEIKNAKGVIETVKRENDSLKIEKEKISNKLVSLQKRQTELSKEYSECDSVQKNIINNQASWETKRDELKQMIYQNIYDKASKFVFTTDYDLEKNMAYRMQAKEYQKAFPENNHSKELTNLISNLKNNEKIIIAIQNAKQVLNNPYAVKEVQKSNEKIDIALSVKKNQTILSNYKTLLTNYSTKTNTAFKLLKTAKSFYSIGQAKDAKQLLNDNKTKFKDYPFLSKEFQHLLSNSRYKLKIKKCKQ